MKKKILCKTPPMGWNSFDCFGCTIYEDEALANLEVMHTRLQPLGYEYFVIDNGWFGEYEFDEDKNPATRHASDVHLDEYGCYEPSETFFPNGLQPLIDKAHSYGLKFGLHLMRGISRKAVELNLPIRGTEYHARDIANTNDTCIWCHYNYGVDATKFGAQAFYDSIVEKLASWGVDFIKADDITGFEDEITLLANAIEKCDREMVLSLSPGGQTDYKKLDVYKRADMLRTTRDIWDNKDDIDQAFEAWKTFQHYDINGMYFDMDMIPFGHLKVNCPTKKEEGESDKRMLFSGKGHERFSRLTKAQMRTFITMRSLAASPLFMGGDLVTSDVYSFELICNKEMIACNQNGVVGKLLYEKDGVEVWHAKQKAAKGSGWIGIFNRNNFYKEIRLDKLLLDFMSVNTLLNIWSNEAINLNDILNASIAGDDVLFIKYEEQHCEEET